MVLYVKQNLRFPIFHAKHAFTDYDFPQEIRTYLLTTIFECYTCV